MKATRAQKTLFISYPIFYFFWQFIEAVVEEEGETGEQFGFSFCLLLQESKNAMMEELDA